MSSSGVRFHTEESLRIGERLEMAMNWPASLDGNCRLKLVAFGRIVRLCEEGAVMQIEKYEFRTRGTNGLL